MSLLEAVLNANDQPSMRLRPEPPRLITAQPEPYGMDDALSELFLEQPALERFIAIWDGKKNLILQGAPGVGKSFVAKRLAYLLLEQKDSGRIEYRSISPVLQLRRLRPRLSPRRKGRIHAS